VTTVSGIVYESSDTNVLTVTSTGRLQAVGPGSATVMVTLGGQTDSAVITVNPLVRPVLHVRLSGTDIVLTWTETGVAFSVESTPALVGSNAVWSATGLVPVDVNGQMQVTIPLGMDQEFYFRLTD